MTSMPIEAAASSSSEIASSASRHEAEAAHDRPRGIDESEQQHLDGDVQEIGGRDERHGGERREPDEPGRDARVHRAKIPRGRTNINTMNSVKARTYAHSVEK